MPKLITLNLGYGCNSKCIMCVLPGFESPFFTADEVKSTILDIPSQTGDCIELTGGEPTLHSDFIDLCRFAVQNSKAEVWLLSNGRRFQNPKFTKDFSSTGCKGVIVALHSHLPSTHDRITNVIGSFSETFRGLKNLQDSGIALIVRFIAMRCNYKDAPALMKLIAEEFPRQRIMMSGVCYMGLAAQNAEEIGIPYRKIRRYIDSSLGIASEYEICACLHLFPVCIFDPSHWKYFDPKFNANDTAANYFASIKAVKENNEYAYPSKCRRCETKYLCNWEWEVYSAIYGLGEINPQKAQNGAPRRQ